jgi:predicted anti-sigma-YlaC factor YlaD
MNDRGGPSGPHVIAERNGVIAETEWTVQTQEHKDIREKLDSYCAGSLDGVAWVKVRTHLAGCDSCRAELTQPMRWSRASPRRIQPPGHRNGGESSMPRPDHGFPRWSTVVSAASLAALVAFSLGHGLAIGGW